MHGQFGSEQSSPLSHTVGLGSHFWAIMGSTGWVSMGIEGLIWASSSQGGRTRALMGLQGLVLKAWASLGSAAFSCRQGLVHEGWCKRGSAQTSNCAQKKQ
eukprot:1158342-Pelagomonas_calceolata.AAC.8